MVQLGGHRENLYCNTGSRLTIIPSEIYQEDMGEVVAAKCHLRAWGSDKCLDTKGLFKTIIKTAGGLRKETWVYLGVGTNPGFLLWDDDAEDLVVISFNPEGTQQNNIRNISIPSWRLVRKGHMQIPPVTLVPCPQPTRGQTPAGRGKGLHGA